jgi:hypothetical protein
VLAVPAVMTICAAACSPSATNLRPDRAVAAVAAAGVVVAVAVAAAVRRPLPEEARVAVAHQRALRPVRW